MSRSIMALLLTALLSGCLSWYTGEPDAGVFAKPAKTSELYYSVQSPLGIIGATGAAQSSHENPEHKRGVRNALEKSQLFSGINVYPSINAMRLEKINPTYFLSVKIIEGNPSPGSMVWAYVSWILLTLIPVGYSSELSIECELHKYDEALKIYKKADSYVYDTRKRTFMWLPVVILTPLNFATGDPEDIVEISVSSYLERVIRSGKLSI
ncbi:MULTISPECIES: hypothetical protein [unclassified Leptospira]|uniref:hypothetical protein n=1 Tax=unclassified Leptospira TaxID=2633828 RepID=UPI0012F6FCF0|nr:MULTISPECIES: hypothetical protein [unclassified Leptospira]MCR1794415.1 hypothetical protein [Leptospira sp. id769339]